MEEQKELQVDRTYAVKHSAEWHIATWDGDCFNVISNLQSGDRWIPQWVEGMVLLPE